MKYICIILVSILCISNAIAQSDSVKAIQELPKIETSKTHSPKTATIMSAACPGLGQIYNKNYWKVPVIYAGFIGLGYGYVYTQKYYKEFKGVYDDYRDPFLKIGKTPTSDTTLSVFGESGYYPANVKAGRDYYHRYRDLCLMGMGTWYLLNILEAYVYANLYDFDTSDDLSFRIEPYYFYTSKKPITGLKISLSF